MIGGQRRTGRAAMALAGLACAAGLAACNGDGGSAAAPTTTAPAAVTASATPAATKEAPSSDAKPCDLLTPAMAAEVFQKTPPATPETDSPTMCSYTVNGESWGDTVSLAIEKWQDGRTVRDELADLGIGGAHGRNNPQSLADEGLGADAVDVWDDSSVAVIWKAGNVQKLVVSTSANIPDTKALLIDVAQKIHAAED